MTRGLKFRERRVREGIQGYLVCNRARKSRSWLSDIERGYLEPSTEEMGRLDAILDELISAKKLVRQAAAEVGWPAGVPVGF